MDRRDGFVDRVPTLAYSAAAACGIVVFSYSWWWCYDRHGYLLGFGLGWIPSGIAAITASASLCGIILAAGRVLSAVGRRILGRHGMQAANTAFTAVVAGFLMAVAVIAGVALYGREADRDDRFQPAIPAMIPNAQPVAGPLAQPSRAIHPMDDDGAEEGERPARRTAAP